jgi:hypothetical protein
VILPNVNLVEFFRKWITEGETSRDLPPFIVPLSELEFCNFPSPCELL